MDATESRDEAVATARKRVHQLTEKFPHHLSVKEEHLPKKIQKLSGANNDKLTLLYKVTDQMFSEVAPFTPCKKGCSSCCHIPVQIAQEEAEYIQEKTGTPIVSTRPAQDFLGIPCPFVVNDTCSIYEHRPYACRRHTVVFRTAYWCAVDRCTDITAPQVRFTGLDAAFRVVVGSGEMKDIRQLFAPNNIATLKASPANPTSPD